MEIIRYASADEAKEGLAKRVSSLLASFQENGTPVLFLFSGGSALGIFDGLDADIFGPYLTMAPIDERFDPSGKESNFAAFAATEAFRRAVSAGTDLIDTRVAGGEDRDALAERFERAIRKWMTEHPGGKTIAILGMGLDGHTAGIFPMDDESAFRSLFEGDRWVIGYRGPEYATCPERITATLSFLAHRVDSAFVFLAGAEKRASWERVTGEEGPLHALPAGIFRRLPDVEIFTDLV